MFESLPRYQLKKMKPIQQLTPEEYNKDYAESVKKFAPRGKPMPTKFDCLKLAYDMGQITRKKFHELVEGSNALIYF